ncbi:MAG: hypothetical protein LBB75_07025 [Oscillospiraceae bacterium]|nr:hypothetical protein [Oscillospiraceae bacterium]
MKRQGTRAAEKKLPPLPYTRKYTCFRCQSEYTRPEPNFFKAQSTLYRGNNGHIHICKQCVNDLFGHYFDAIGDGKSAMHRLCEKLDVYWNEEIWASVCMKTSTAQSRAAAYFRQANLRQYKGKTFDDWHDEDESLEEAWAAIEAAHAVAEEDRTAATVTLEEARRLESEALAEVEQARRLQEEAQTSLSADDGEPAGPSPEQLDRWGAELPAWYYDEADRVYSHWDAKLDPAVDRNDAANSSSNRFAWPKCRSTRRFRRASKAMWPGCRAHTTR